LQNKLDFNPAQIGIQQQPLAGLLKKMLFKNEPTNNHLITYKTGQCQE
jgi:hypothetical protein